MKKQKAKAISLTLAGALVFAGMASAPLVGKVSADEAASYALTDIFVASKATITHKAIVNNDVTNNVSAFSLEDGGKVQMKNSVALKWFEETGDNVTKKVEAQYFSTSFAFDKLNFDSVTFTMESQSAWAVEDEKAVNTITFKQATNGLSVVVNDQAAQDVEYNAGEVLTLKLKESNEDGEFNVLLGVGEVANDAYKTVGQFVNVGANYAAYTAGKQYPFAFSADMPEVAEGQTAESAMVLLYDINGQQFDNATVSDTTVKVTDNAAPVVVVNEEIHAFLYGAAFSLDYTVLDVLKTKNLDKDLEYYQYNPSLKEGNEDYQKFAELSTGVYFYSTSYYKDPVTGEALAKDADTTNAVLTSVYKEQGYELVSIQLKVGDGNMDKATYDLSWYAVDGVTESIDGLNYLPINNSQKGPSYKILTAGDEENEKSKNYDDLVGFFQEQLNKSAKDLYAGSDSYLYFPSMKWMFDDDNGYRNLKFAISYKVGNGTAKTSTGLSYNAVKLTVSQEGEYEFRIFANDKAGNKMKYFTEDGELVEVTTENIWDIQDAPTFTFTIENKALRAKDPTSDSGRRETEIIDRTYTFSDVTVQGAENLQKAYKLYKVDLGAYTPTGTTNITGVNRKDLYAVTYEELADKVDLTKVTDDNYFEHYINAYAAVLADKIGAPVEDIEKIAACFTEIKQFNSRITEENAPEEWELYNKYKWDPDSRSFTTAEEGEYLIMADYYEKALATSHRAAAYKLVVVQSEADVIEGTNEWLQNNLASVILFAFAGICFIALIVLLLVKPSEETLEEIDAAAAKTEKADKDSKK